MKYSTALTLCLAFGPATILAAPLIQDPTAVAPSPQQNGGNRPAAPAPSSASQGLSGQSSGNEGLLDKVEKIIKDVLGGLRKRGIVEEVGEVIELTLESTSELLNGQSSSAQSSYNTQSTDPDALPQGAPQNDAQQPAQSPAPAAAQAPAPPTAPVPPTQPSNQSSGSNSANSALSKLLGGRSMSNENPPQGQTDPINTVGTTAPVSLPTENNNMPSESAPIHYPGQQDQAQGSPSYGTDNGAVQLSPEDIQSLKAMLASQSQKQDHGHKDGQDIPQLTDA